MQRYILLVILILGFYSCTKDDLCSGEISTTPLLTIEFLDHTDRVTPKPTNDLQVRLRDVDSTVVFTSISDITLSVPLDTENDRSLFYFIHQAASPDNINVVDLDLYYSRQDQYVNRACAFKTIYTNLAFESNQTILSWIQDIELLTPTVENASVHLYIYH